MESAKSYSYWEFNGNIGIRKADSEDVNPYLDQGIWDVLDRYVVQE
jgi:hypothetical protein